MKTLRIFFEDFWPEWPHENFITPILSKYFNIVIDSKNTDILFHSIFGNPKKASQYKCKKILILAENWRPKQFNTNYSISYDPHSETNFRLPLWQIYWLLWPELKNQLINKKKHNNFKEFCAFTVSNPSNSLRNNCFDQLSNYKKVQAYGKVKMNNIGLMRASQGKYWRDAKLQYFNENSHKFMMSFENTSTPYYCTEKIMDAFLVGAIPIYWGDQKVKEDWNEKAFINIMENSNWINKIIELDKNEELFNKIYNEPVFTDEQLKKHEENINNFESWIIQKSLQ